MQQLTVPLETRAGPERTKEILNSHRAAILELQDEVKNQHNDDGEEFETFMIQNADLVRVTLKGFIQEVVN